MSTAEENLKEELLKRNRNSCESSVEETSDNISERTFSVRRIVNVPHIGLILALIAALSSSFHQVLMKICYNAGVQVKSYLFYNSAISTVSLLLILSVQRFRTNIKKSELMYQFFLSCIFVFACFFTVYAFKYTTALYATSLLSTQIIFAAFLSRFLLKEPIGRFDTVIILFVLIGSVLIANPFQIIDAKDDSQQHTIFEHFLGCICAVGISLFMACFSFTNRKLQHVNPVFIQFTSFSLLAVFSVIYLEFNIELPKTKYQWMWLLIAAFSTTFGNLMRSAACQLENITYVSLILTQETPIVLVLQWIILKQLPGICESCGIVIAVVSVIIWSLKPIYLHRRYTSATQ